MDNQNGQVMDALFETLNFLDGGGDEPEPVDSADVYIVGGDGAWSLTEPLGKMANLGNGTYVDTLTVSTAIYFVFADGGPDVWNNDWTLFNGSYRYGPTSTTTVMTDTQYSTAKRDNNYSYYFVGDGSNYVFTFDADNLVFSLSVLELQPSVLLGDVNGDGSISIGDVTALINYLLGGQQPGFIELNADVNQDGKISIADVTGIISILLSKRD